MSVRATEQSSLFKSQSTEPNYLPEKVCFGTGLIGALGVVSYQGVLIAHEVSTTESTWLGVGALAALLGVSIFGLARAHQHSSHAAPELLNVTIQDDVSNTETELQQIIQKIKSIVNTLPQENEDSTSISDQETFKPFEAFKKIESYLTDLETELAQVDSINQELEASCEVYANELEQLQVLINDMQNNKDYTPANFEKIQRLLSAAHSNSNSRDHSVTSSPYQKRLSVGTRTPRKLGTPKKLIFGNTPTKSKKDPR